MTRQEQQVQQQQAQDSDAALLRRLWRAALTHHVRTLETAETATAAELVAAQRFLADSGVSLATLDDLDRHSRDAGLAKLLKGIPDFGPLPAYSE